jgi:hypothetical protein
MQAMLIGAKLPEFLWELAVAHAAYLRNCANHKSSGKCNAIYAMAWKETKCIAFAQVWSTGLGSSAETKCPTEDVAEVEKESLCQI